MCDPVTMTVLAVTATAAGVAQDQQAANTANKYEKVAYGQRKDAALQTQQQLREREFQERAKAAQDIRAVTTQARAAAATARLSAAESGTGGASVDALLADFRRGELVNRGLGGDNLAALAAQIRAEQTAAGRIEAKRKHQGPLDSTLGIVASGLQVAGAGMTAYNSTPKPK